MSMSLAGRVEKKKIVKTRKQKVDAFVIVVNFGGADMKYLRWGDVTIVPMTALDETSTSHLKTLIERTKERTTGPNWSVYIDITGEFPKDEDTRVDVGDSDEFTKPEIEEAIEQEIFHLICDSQGNFLGDFLCKIDESRIVGKVIYHTEM